MFKKLTISVLFIVNSIDAQQWEWVTTVNENRTDRGKNIAVDKDKNVFVTGLVTNSGNRNLWMKDFLWKFDSTGVLLWKQELDPKLLNSKMICDLSGNVYITAGNILERRSGSGNLIWRVQHPDVTNFSGIKEFSDGGIIVIGARKTEEKSKKALIARYDESGTCLWTVYSGLIGTSLAIMDYKIYVVGGNGNDSLSINYGFLAIYDQFGVLQSRKTIPHSPIDVEVDAQGSIVVTGSFGNPIEINGQIFTNHEPTTNYFIIKYDQNYSVLWHKIVTGSIWGGWLQTDKESNVYFTISAVQSLKVNDQTIPASPNGGILIMKMNSVGHIIFSTFSDAGVTTSGIGSASVSDFCLDHAHNIYFTGSTAGNHFFGKHEIRGEMYYTNLFVAKLIQDQYPQVSISEKDKDSRPVFEIFPNPFSDIFTIQGSSTTEKYLITLTDVRGQVLKTGIAKAGTANTIDLSDCANGIYFVQIKCGDRIETKKLVKN